MKKLFTMCVMLCCVIVAMAQEFTATTAEGYELKYVVLGAEHRTAECQGLVDKYYGAGASADLVIPDSVKYIDSWYQVTSIRKSAFSGCSGFTGNLTIGDGVTSIGESAFGGCSGFTNLEVAEGNLYYAAGDMMLFSKDMTTLVMCLCGKQGDLVIPADVKSIGRYAFSYCDGLTGNLVIPDGVKSIGDYAFSSCSGFSGSLTIGAGVDSIGYKAFYGCRGFTGSLVMGENVKTIGEEAFVTCFGFTGSLTIPDGVTSIGESAFEGCRGFTGSLTIGAGVDSIGYRAFYGCRGFTGSLMIGAGVESIGEDAFSGCSGFTNLEVVESNLHYAASDMMLFSKDMTTLVMYLAKKTGELVIPDGVKSIGKSAFSGCSGFTGSLTIPADVTSIGDYAFFGCSGFTGSLTIPAGVTSIGERAFGGCSGFTNLEVAEGNVHYAAGDMMLFSKDMTTLVMCLCGKQGDLVIPADVTSIGDYAFFGCKDLTGSLTIPAGVTSIGEWAFYGCSGLTGSLTIPAGVTSIGEGAFAHCSSLTGSLAIPDGVESIGWDAFRDCKGFIGSLTIGKSLSSVSGLPMGHDSFTEFVVSEENETYASMDGILYNKDKTTVLDCPEGKTGKLLISAGVTSIIHLAFYGCSGFTDLQVESENTCFAAQELILFDKDMNKIVLCLSSKSGELIIPISVDSIGDYAFYGCRRLTGDLVIPASMESIGRYAFEYCSGFSGSLTIGDSVKSIGENAFSSCSGFSGSLTIGGGVERIGHWALNGCRGFTSVTNKAFVPQVIDEYVFRDVVIGSIPLYVPEESISLYEDVAVWKDFMSIEAINYTALEGVMQEVPFVQQGHVLTFAQPTFVSIFTVSGQLVRSGIMEQCVLPAERGVYVVQTVKGSFKVMVND